MDPAPPGTDRAGAARTLSSTTVYRNDWMRVRQDTIVQADGAVATYGVVDKTDFAVVIAETTGSFYLVEQFRYPIGRRSWEFPMGTWPAGRSGTALDLARAELVEETGVTAACWRQLGHRMHGATGFCSQGFTVFHATELTVGAPNREASESDMVADLVPEATVRSMIANGSIVDGPTITAYGLFRLFG